MKHDCVDVQRLHIEVATGAVLTIRNPERPLETADVNGPCSCKGSVQVVRGIEWLILEHVRSFGLQLRDLKQAWDDLKVEVRCINPDGTEKEYFDA